MGKIEQGNFNCSIKGIKDIGLDKITCDLKIGLFRTNVGYITIAVLSSLGLYSNAFMIINFFYRLAKSGESSTKNTMKKLFVSIIAMLAVASAHAQIEEGNWFITPKVGVSVADMTGQLFDPTKAEGTYDATLHPLTGFTAGVELEYGLADQVGLSFGLFYAKQGAKTDDGLFKVKMDYAKIPLMLNYYPIPNAGLALKAGVQIGFASRKRITIDGVEYNADNTRAWWINRWGRAIPVVVENELSRQFNKVDFSIPVAVSYELYNFVMEARYNIGLTKVMKEDPESSKHMVWQFTLGYKIPLGDD